MDQLYPLIYVLNDLTAELGSGKPCSKENIDRFKLCIKDAYNKGLISAYSALRIIGDLAPTDSNAAESYAKLKGFVQELINPNGRMDEGEIESDSDSFYGLRLLEGWCQDDEAAACVNASTDPMTLGNQDSAEGNTQLEITYL